MTDIRRYAVKITRRIEIHAESAEAAAERAVNLYQRQRSPYADLSIEVNYMPEPEPDE